MRRLICVLLVYCSTISPAPADTISLSSIIPLVLENDPTVKITGRSLDSSQHNRELLLAGTRPQITMNNNEITNLTTHGISASMNLTQVLPTDGTLTAGVSDSITIVEKGEDITINQSPRLGLSVSQPVFTNGKVIDLSIYPARRSLYGDIPVSRSSLRAKAAKNSGLLNAFSAYTSNFCASQAA